ncbi:hypothetical protein H7F33_05195 [Pedobacter sp. PAMC26386]|nr:hypothetical protein H7F33_05195 [Pedobacter sp. PAMC26386]
MDNSIFQIIAEDLTNKNTKRIALSLTKGYKPTIAAKLEIAKDLAMALYFSGDEKNALKICQILGKEKFNGNYNLWTWVQTALLLACWIYDKQGCKEEGVRSLLRVTEIIDINTGDEQMNQIRIKARDRRLKGELLRDEKIDQAVEQGDKKQELAWRQLQFSELLYIYLLGGSNEIPVDKALAAIEKNEQFIKELV